MGLLSAISDFAGPISSGINYFSARDTNRKQKKMAREQMAFQERMSNTSYQRAVKDMRAAGINPMLAYIQGGATTPGGAQAAYKAPRVDEAQAARTTKLKPQTEQIRLTNQNLQNQNSLIVAQTRAAEAQAASAKELARVYHGQAEKADEIGQWYRRNPDLVGFAEISGGAGAVASSAKSAGITIRNIMRRLWR